MIGCLQTDRLMLSGVCADWSRSSDDDNDTVLCARKTNLQHNNNTPLYYTPHSPLNGSITHVHNKYMSTLSTYYILHVRALFCVAINVGDLKHLHLDYIQ